MSFVTMNTFFTNTFRDKFILLWYKILIGVFFLDGDKALYLDFFHLHLQKNINYLTIFWNTLIFIRSLIYLFYLLLIIKYQQLRNTYNAFETRVIYPYGAVFQKSLKKAFGNKSKLVAMKRRRKCFSSFRTLKDVL